MLLFITIAFSRKFKYVVYLIVPVIALYLISIKSDVLTSEALRGLSGFFAGALTYLFYKKINYIKPTKLFSNILEIILIVLIVIIAQSKFEYYSIVKTLLFCAVVLVFSFEIGVLSNFLKLKPFQIVGKLSYSIYMTHSAIILCLNGVAMILQKITDIEFILMLEGGKHITSGSPIINNVIVLLILFVVLLVSNFTYKFIEIKWQKVGTKVA